MPVTMPVTGAVIGMVDPPPPDSPPAPPAAARENAPVVADRMKSFPARPDFIRFFKTLQRYIFFI
jgi:hypothetical protein